MNTWNYKKPGILFFVPINPLTVYGEFKSIRNKR